jgi:hypothetical protein
MIRRHHNKRANTGATLDKYVTEESYLRDKYRKVCSDLHTMDPELIIKSELNIDEYSVYFVLLASSMKLNDAEKVIEREFPQAEILKNTYPKHIRFFIIRTSH